MFDHNGPQTTHFNEISVSISFKPVPRSQIIIRTTRFSRVATRGGNNPIGVCVPAEANLFEPFPGDLLVVLLAVYGLAGESLLSVGAFQMVADHFDITGCEVGPEVQCLHFLVTLQLVFLSWASA